MNQETVKHHFWLGSFPAASQAYEYFAEVYDSEDEDGEYTPLSKFARDQGEKWYDHDFMECVFNENGLSEREFIKTYCPSKECAEELESRRIEMDLDNINFWVFIADTEISSPKTVINNEFSLHYVGKIARIFP